MEGFSAANGLNERGIDLTGQQYYAVVTAYLDKIYSLANPEGKEKLDSFALLKQAGKAQVLQNKAEQEALEHEFAKVVNQQFVSMMGLKNSAITDYINAKLTSADNGNVKVQNLHDYAINMGTNREELDSYVFSKKLSNLDSKLSGDKNNYCAQHESYQNIVAIEHDDKALENFFRLQAPNSNLNDQIRDIMRSNAVELENEFLHIQSDYIGQSVSYLVDSECLINRALQRENAAKTNLEAFA